MLAEADDELQIILVATGSEVQIALEARSQLHAAGIGTRVVSMPSVEWFADQHPAYRDQVLPPTVAARVSVEAGIAAGWELIVGDAGRSVSVEHFGASADAATLYRELGITPDAVVTAAHESRYDARHGTRPGGHPARLRCHGRRNRGPAGLISPRHRRAPRTTSPADFGSPLEQELVLDDAKRFEHGSTWTSSSIRPSDIADSRCLRPSRSSASRTRTGSCCI